MLLSIWQCHFSLRSWRCYKLSLFLQRLHMSGFCSGWQFVSNTYQVVSALPTTGNSPPSPGCTLGRRRPLQRVWRPLWWGPAPVQRGEEGQTAPLIASHLANKEFFREKAYCCLWCWSCQRWCASVSVPSRWSASLRGEYRRLFIHFFWSVLIWGVNLIKCICSSPGSL